MMTIEEMTMQEALLTPLAVYKEQLEKLENEAETVAYSSWATCGREFDESQLDELREILRNAAEEVRTVLLEKVAELPSDMDEELLDAYGLSEFRN